MTRICFIAAPLIARSGVYHSTVELVSHARSIGLDWSAIIGVSEGAGGTSVIHDGITEIQIEPSGPVGILRLSRDISRHASFVQSDLAISMIPQSDMALSILRRPWVAYLRGLPWPNAGEAASSRTRMWRQFERLALSRAREVWATTPRLAKDFGGRVDRLVPPGIAKPGLPRRTPLGTDFVWAARYSLDKNPALFLEMMTGKTLRGVMYGSGPLEEELRVQAPSNVSVPGWRDKAEIWENARAYVGTSSREAFGRSAVEAAMLGIPVIISEEFGCAESLYTDPDLAKQFVLPLDNVSAWRAAADLLADDQTRDKVSQHVSANASRLTIDAAVANVVAAASQVAIHSSA